MQQISGFSLPVGPLLFQYQYIFYAYLIVGWLTILFHAKKNYDQPTYNMEENEPSSVMMPRFFFSHHLYERGFFIYIVGMTVVFVVCSFTGPALVEGIFAAFRDPTNFHYKEPASSPFVVPSEWPLLFALCMVGLAPQLPIARGPELFLRRIGHRVALIPAYAKDIAFKLEQAPFAPPAILHFRYPIGIQYKPDIGSKATLDDAWLKICLLLSYTKSLTDGTTIPDSAKRIGATDRAAVHKEVQVLYAPLRDLDERLRITATEEERAKYETDIQQLLRRACLLLACTLIVFRVRDINTEIGKIGFGMIGTDTRTIGPVLAGLCTLFLFLIIGDRTYTAMAGERGASIVDPRVIYDIWSTFNTVCAFAVAFWAGMTVCNKRKASGDLNRSSGWEKRLFSYFMILLAGYAASWAVLGTILFPTLSLQGGVERWIDFTLYRSIAPAVAGVVASIWVSENGFRSLTMPARLAISSCVIAVVAGFAGFLFYVNAHVEDNILGRVIYDALQGMVSGFVMGLLAEVMEAYQVRTARSAWTRGYERAMGAVVEIGTKDRTG
jgi:hypothetical protein